MVENGVVAKIGFVPWHRLIRECIGSIRTFDRMVHTCVFERKRERRNSVGEIEDVEHDKNDRDRARRCRTFTLSLRNKEKYQPRKNTKDYKRSNPACEKHKRTDLMKYDWQKKYKEGLERLKMQEEVFKRAKNEVHTLAQCNIQIATCYNGLKKHDKAIKLLLETIEIAEKRKYNHIMSQAFCELSLAYEKSNKPVESLRYYKKYKELSDTLLNAENSTTMANLQFQYKSDKEEKIREIEEAKKIVEHLAQINQHKIVICSIIFGLILVIVFLLFLYNRFRIIRSQKAIIEDQKRIVDEKQKDILDSIHYARRIQRSLLTPEKYIEKNLGKWNE